MGSYLLTGGAGFIGSNLARFVLSKGNQVTILDNFSTGKRENLAQIADQIRLIEGDIRDAGAVRDAMTGVDGVFHLAALGSVPRSVADPETSHDVNVNGTLRILQTVRELNIRRIVFSASSSAYGNQPISPKVETMPVLPISPYAANKVTGEAYMQAWAGAYGMETVSLRYFNVFGPRQDPHGAYAAVIPAFVSTLLRGERPTIFGDGEQSRDFCFIANVCDANWRAMTMPASQCDGRPINIACNRRTTLNQIFAKLRELLGVDIEPVYAPARRGDVRHSQADISRAREVLGYEPLVYFDEGLERAIGWYRENLG